MTGNTNYRRVVTGLDTEGKSCVIFDGEIPDPGGNGVGIVWRTSNLPADNSRNDDAADQPFSFELMHAGGSLVSVIEYPPGISTFMHATDTIDYIVVLRGEVVLALEKGEVTCGPGTIIVDRGVVHAWRNDGQETAAIAVIVLPAHPVGKGRTV